MRFAIVEVICLPTFSFGSRIHSFSCCFPGVLILLSSCITISPILSEYSLPHDFPGQPGSLLQHSGARWSLGPIHLPLNGFQKVATIFLSELIAGPGGPLHTQQRMYTFLPYLSSSKLTQLFGVHICKLDHTVFN